MRFSNQKRGRRVASHLAKHLKNVFHQLIWEKFGDLIIYNYGDLALGLPHLCLMTDGMGSNPLKPCRMSSGKKWMDGCTGGWSGTVAGGTCRSLMLPSPPSRCLLRKFVTPWQTLSHILHFKAKERNHKTKHKTSVDQLNLNTKQEQDTIQTSTINVFYFPKMLPDTKSCQQNGRHAPVFFKVKINIYYKRKQSSLLKTVQYVLTQHCIQWQ